MKRLTIITTLIMLAGWANYVAFAASPIEAISENMPIGFHDETCLDMKIAPVFNSTGMLVSDPTGTLLNPIHAECRSIAVMGTDVKIAPIFDATGAVVSDPTGTILSFMNP